MGETANLPALQPVSPGKWIAKIVLAVILGEAIWGLLVSLTNGLIVPGLAQIMGGDSQSPLYLGKGDFNLPSIFVSILELGLAGIVAVVLYQWSQSGPARVRVRTVKMKTVAAKTSVPSIAPTSVMPPAASAARASALSPQPLPVQPAPVAPPVPAAVPQPKPPVPQPAAAKPEKPKKPHEVYYNIVGEPINPTKDDE